MIIILTKKVLDFILNKSRRALTSDVKQYIDCKITEKDCALGIVNLLTALFQKTRHDGKLKTICGSTGRKDLNKLISVSISQLSVFL